MVEQLRNQETVELNRADFFARNEPNAAWSHTVSDHLLLPALRGFWPMSANHKTANGVFVDDIACGYDLEMVNTPTLQSMPYGLPPACHFTAANSDYLSYGADDVQHVIRGTETNVLAVQNGLSLGCWAWFGIVDTSQVLMAKGLTAGNQLAYWIYKTVGNQMVFAVSSLGTPASIVLVTHPTIIAVNTWYNIFARFIPSVKLDIYVDAVRETSAAAAPASIFNSNNPLEFGQIDAASYFDGFASLVWLSASCAWDGVAATRDVIPFALYQHSKRLFNK